MAAPKMDLPISYNALHLPDIKLSHHPATSPTPTPVIILTLNRPRQKNAFTYPMATSIIKAMSLISADPRVKAVVVTGSDPANKIFCAGMDLSVGFGTGSETRDSFKDAGGRVTLALFDCTKPVICAMNGAAVGVGVTMTLGANIRVACKSSKVGFVFGRRGIVMEACSSFFLPRLIGASRAMALLTMAEPIRASHALYDGLFAELVDEPGQVLPAALRIAETVAVDVSGVSVRMMKDMIFRGPNSPEEAHLLESKILFDRFNSRDCKEGVESFMEKRKVDFKGTMQEDCPSAWPWWNKNLLEEWKSKL